MKIFSGLLLLLIPFFAAAQDQFRPVVTIDPCLEFERLMSEVDNELAKIEFESSFIFAKLRSARVLARDCSIDSVVEVDNQFKEFYSRLETLRADAVAAEKRALAAEKRAQESALNAQITANANYNAAQAIKISRTNPTLGLRMAEHTLMNNRDNPSVATSFHDIISFNTSAFYQQEFTGHRGAVEAIAFSPEGDQILIGTQDGRAVLWDRTGRPVDTLYMNEEIIRSVAFSPDGQLLAAGSDNGQSVLWDRQGRPVDTLSGHRGSIRSMAFSPDSKYLLTASNDKWAILWDREGRPVDTLIGHESGIYSVAFSPDDRFMLTGSYDGQAILWDRQGRKVGTLSGHSAAVNSVAISPRGDLLLTGSADRTARLWSEDGKPLQTFRGHQLQVTSVAFSPDGQRVITGSKDQTVRLWDLQGTLLQEFRADNQPVNSVAFAPDGTQFLTGLGDGSARLWNLSDNHATVFDNLMLRGWVLCVAFSPDGNRMLTGSRDHNAILWNADGQPTDTLEAHYGGVEAVAFSPDGRYALTGSTDSTALLWDLDSLDIPVPKPLSFRHHHAVEAVAFSPDGNLILTGSWDRTAKLWDRSGKLLTTLEGHDDYVEAVAFSPDGRYVLTASKDRKAIIWEIEKDTDTTATLQYPLEVHEADVEAVAFSPDGRFLLTGSRDSTAVLWDWSAKNRAPQKKKILRHKGDVWAVTFSPDSEHILTGSADHTARVWDLEGNTIRILRGHHDDVEAVAFSESGYMLTGSWDNLAKVWTPLGVDTLELAGHLQRRWDEDQSSQMIDSPAPDLSVSTIVFSPVDDYFLSAVDTTLTLWNKNGNEEASWTPHDRRVTDAVFSPDGKFILTSSSDGKARLWNLKGEMLKEMVHQVNMSVEFVAFLPPDEAGQASILTVTSYRYRNYLHIWNLEGESVAGPLLFEQNNSIPAFAVSPDGAYLLTGSSNSLAYLWQLDGKTLSRSATFGGHEMQVNAVAFSPDGQYILTGSEDRTAKFWNIRTKEELATFVGHTGPVRGVAFSPDGNYVLTGSDDRKAKVWDLVGNELFTLTGHLGPVREVAFSPGDGRYLLTGSADQTARLWLSWPEFLNERVAKVPFGSFLLAGLRISNEELAEFRRSASLEDLESAADYYYKEQEWKVARAFYEEALKHQPANAEYYVKLYQIDERTGIPFDRSRLSAIDEDPEGLARFGELFYLDEKWEEARNFFRRSYVMQPEVDKLRRLYQIAVKIERPFEFRLTQDLKEAADLVTLADFFYRQDQWDSAGKLYERANALETSVSSLSRLYEIAERTEATFDFELTQALNTPEDLVTFGRFFFDRQQWQYAGKLYARANTLQANYQTVRKLYEIAERTEATFDFELVQDLEEPEDLSALGDFFYERQELEYAWKLYEKVNLLRPSYTALSNLYRIAGRTDRVFDFALTRELKQVGELSRLADYFYRQRQWAYAGVLYNRVVEENPEATYFQRLYEIAKVDSTQGPFNMERIYALEDVSIIDPMVTFFLNEGKLLEVDSLLLMALKLDWQNLKKDTSKTVTDLACKHYNNLGYIRILRGMFLDGERAIQEGIGVDSTYYILYTKLPFAQLLRGETAKADSTFRHWWNKPYERNENRFRTFPDAYLYYFRQFGDHFREKEDWDLFALLMEEGMKLFPMRTDPFWDWYKETRDSSWAVPVGEIQSPEILSELATELVPEGKWEEAEQMFQRTVEAAEVVLLTDSSSTRAIAGHYNDLAYVQFHTGHYAESEASIMRGIAIDSTNHYLYTKLPFVYLFQGRYEEAESAAAEWIGQRLNFRDTRNRFGNFREAYQFYFNSFSKAGIIPKQYLEEAQRFKKFLDGT